MSLMLTLSKEILSSVWQKNEKYSLVLMEKTILSRLMIWLLWMILKCLHLLVLWDEKIQAQLMVQREFTLNQLRLMLFLFEKLLRGREYVQTALYGLKNELITLFPTLLNLVTRSFSVIS